jgi:hypothetical protein
MFAVKRPKTGNTVPVFRSLVGAYGCLNQLFPPIWLLPWAR